MPKARVGWFDADRGRGVVVHGGREYAVAAEDIDPKARRAGAPVHFDIDHTAGGDVAVNVTLRAGTRTGHRTGRVGDQTGAHHEGDKGRAELEDTGALTTRRRAYGDQPRRLVEDWAGRLTRGDTAAAAGLYAPDAVIHGADGRTVTGARDLRRHLEAGPLAGARPARDGIAGLPDGRFRVRWKATAGTGPAATTVVRIADGRIAEQWTRTLD